MEMYISAQLLEMIEKQAMRKFVVYDEDVEDSVAGMMVSHSPLKSR